jgi:hypothetical protein
VSAHDPPRLLARGSALDPRLRALLQAGREELPSAAQLERMARRLGPDFASPGLEPPVSTAASTSWVVTALVATAIGLGAAAWWASSPWPARTPTPPPPVPRQDEPRRQPEPDRAARTPLDTDAGRPQVVPDRRVERVRPAARAPDPVEELLIVEEARGALASDPERALAHAQRHRLRFPDGHYAQEREVIAIDALLALRRFAAAQRRSRAFLQEFPGSSYWTRVTAQLERARAGSVERQP